MSTKTRQIHDREVGTYFDGAAQTFDAFYDHKRSGFMQWVDRTFRSDMFERFRITFEALQPLEGATLLDVGCGSGPYLAEVLRRGGSRAVGLDMAPGMLDLARQRVESIGQAEKCSLIQGTYPADAPDERFNYAIVMGVMDYVPDHGAFLSALANQVNKKAVLSFPSKHWFRTPLRKIRYQLKQCPLYFYDRDTIQASMTAAGFGEVVIVKIPGAGMDYVASGVPDGSS